MKLLGTHRSKSPRADEGKTSENTAARDQNDGSPEWSLERQMLLNQYDRAFTELMSRLGPGPKSEILETLNPILNQLSPELRAWSGDARLRAHLLMKEILKVLDDPACTASSLGILALLLSEGGVSALEMARPMFKDKVLAMYREPKFVNEWTVPRVLLMLEDYDPKLLESLMKDMIHTWDEERFNSAHHLIASKEIEQRGLKGSMKGFLRGEIARTGNERDNTGLERAVELYQEVR